MAPFHTRRTSDGSDSMSSISHGTSVHLHCTSERDQRLKHPYHRNPSSASTMSSLDSFVDASLCDSSFQRLETWRHEIMAIEASLEARGVKRAALERKIKRLRETIHKAYDETEAAFRGTAPIDNTNQQTKIQMNMAAEVSVITEDANVESSPKRTSRSSARALLRRSLLEKENAVNRCIQRNSAILKDSSAGQTRIDDLLAVVKEKKLVIEELSSEVQRLQRKVEVTERKAEDDLRKQRAQALNQIEYIERKAEAQQDFLSFQQRSSASEISQLKEQLEESQRRVVELEVELESLELCSKAQRSQLYDTEVLLDGSNASALDVSQSSHAVLDDMKRELVDSTMRSKKLEEQNDFLSNKCQSLQSHLDAYRRQLNSTESSIEFEESESDEGSPTSHSRSSYLDPVSMLQPSLDSLRKRLEILEMQNLEQVKKSRELKAKIQSDAEKAKEASETIASLRDENESLRVKLSSLEIYVKDPTSKSEAPRERSSRFDYLEQKLDSNVNEIHSLEDQLNSKDQIIERLRAQLVDMRLNSEREPERSQCEKPRWIEHDTKTDRTADDSEVSYVAELEDELNNCRRKLREQGEEMTALRITHSTRVANLNARLRKAKKRSKDDKYMYFL